MPIETHCNGYELYEQEQECREEILQCWLEAKHNFDNGEYSLVANKQILDQIKERQNSYVEDDWRIGVIENYIIGKDRTCVKDIWDNAFKYHDRTMTKKDSNDIVAIFDSEFTDEWEKASTIRFADYGRQRGWIRKQKQIEEVQIKDEDELPF